MMVDDLHCNGCGVCVPVCPVGAISLQSGRAFINESLCRQCGLCESACPQGAILSVEVMPLEDHRLTAPIPSEGKQTVVTAPGPTSVSPRLREGALPIIGAAALWVGREIVPRLASLALDRLDRRTQQTSQAENSLYETPVRQSSGRQNRGMGRGRQRQRRNRHR